MSNYPLVKISWLNAEQYQDKKNLVEQATQECKQAKSCLQIYNGTMAENPKVSAWLSIWTSDEDLSSFLDQSIACKAFQGSLKATVVPDDPQTPPTAMYFHLLDPIGELERVAAAPVTAVAEMSLRPGGNINELKVLMTKLKDKLDIYGAQGVGLGQSAEKKGTLYCSAGWTSIDMHLSAMTEGSEAYDVAREIGKIADVTFLKHATFSKVK